MVNEVTAIAAPELMDALFRTSSFPTDDPAVNWISDKPVDVANRPYVAVPVLSADVSVVKAFAVSRPLDAAAKAFDVVIGIDPRRRFRDEAATDAPAGIDPADEL